MRRPGPLFGVTPEYAAEDHWVWDAIRPRDGVPGFLRSEFRQPDAMDAYFLLWLYKVRIDVWAQSKIEGESDVPMRVIDDARHSGGAVGSAHVIGRPCRAVDLQVFNAYERAVLTSAVVRHGCTRWGTYPGNRTARGTDQGGLHVDCSELEVHPSPRNWTRY